MGCGGVGTTQDLKVLPFDAMTYEGIRVSYQSVHSVAFPRTPPGSYLCVSYLDYGGECNERMRNTYGCSLPWLFFVYDIRSPGLLNRAGGSSYIAIPYRLGIWPVASFCRLSAPQLASRFVVWLESTVPSHVLLDVSRYLRNTLGVICLEAFGRD